MNSSRLDRFYSTVEKLKIFYKRLRANSCYSDEIFRESIGVYILLSNIFTELQNVYSKTWKYFQLF